MSQDITPEEIRESRRAALLQKHADGKRLTGDEKKEIEDLINGPGHAEELPEFADSIKHAAALLKERAGIECSPSRLRAVVNALPGSARKHGRIAMAPLLAAMKAVPIEGEETKEALEKRRLRAQCERYEHELALARRQSIPITEVLESDARAVAEFRAALNVLRGDAPRWSGLPPHEIEQRVSHHIQTALAGLEEMFRKLGE